MRIAPLISRAAGDEQGSRRNKRDEQIGIHRHVIPMSGVFLQIARKLVAIILRHVIDRFTVITSAQGRPEFAPLTGKDDGEARVLPRRPTVRSCRDANGRRWRRAWRPLVCRFQIIHDAAQTPSPGADGAPFVWFQFRLSSGQCEFADNIKVGLILGIGFDFRVAHDSVAITAGENIGHRFATADGGAAGGAPCTCGGGGTWLEVVRRSGQYWSDQIWRGRTAAAETKATPHDRHWASGVCRKIQIHMHGRGNLPSPKCPISAL